MNLQLVKKIVVLGGGTSGLVAALVLRRTHPELEIEVVESADIGIIGVGEGSTEHWSQFMKLLQIPIEELLRETDATFKVGIKFDNWNGDGKHYFHSVVHPMDSVFVNSVPSYYTYITQAGLDPIKMITDNFLESKFFKGHVSVSQYHFDTFKLNKYLHTACDKLGITFVEAKIADVKLNENGYVTSLVSDDGRTFEGDFFIDSSGFNRVIMKKLGAEWVDYSKYLPMNHAIAFPTPGTDDIKAYTTSTAMSSGWRWNIPTQTRHGNGYVFDDNFITVDQAVAEVEQQLGHSVDIAKDIKFKAGRSNKAMIKNCLAIGLSAVFVEPLEASSIGTSIQQAFMLTNMLKNYFPGSTAVEDRYNSVFTEVCSNIVDYIQLHYFTKRTDSEFWKAKNFEITDFNKETLETFKHSMPTYLFFDKPYNLFRWANWTMVMAGLGMFDQESIKRLWESQPKDATGDISRFYDYNKEIDSRADIGHREFLDFIMAGGLNTISDVQYEEDGKVKGQLI